MALPEPLPALLHPGPPVGAACVAGAMASSLSLETAADLPPVWLRQDQRHSFARVLAALRRSGVALLADPVGSGKTFVALAVAQVWPGKAPVVVIVPAALRSQWLAVCSRLSIAVVLHSQERLSRGVAPPMPARLAVIDESHHFRNPHSRRYRTLMPCLASTPVLMLSATPVVNRLSDLAHQLLLAARDDVLRDHGVGSLRRLLSTAGGHSSLGMLICSRSTQRPDGPVVARNAEPVRPLELPPAIRAALPGLRLSPEAATASLLRSVFWRALASSPAALLQTLQRYRELLAHAGEASASGHTLDRRSLKRFLGSHPEQLLLWGVLSGSDGDCDLVLDDLALLGEAIVSAKQWCQSGDAGSTWLSKVLSDGRRSLVFTSYRATVRYLRDKLMPLTPAWCIGSQAGIGRSAMEREAVLGWFRLMAGMDGRTDGQSATGTCGHCSGPRVLLTTDVTAEGLDLQLAERVIHYDLPWTATRLQQREGRMIRIGSPHTRVEVLRRDPSHEVEQHLAQFRILQTKGRLPHEVGLGELGRWLFSWRDGLQDLLARGTARRGATAIEGEETGILTGFELRGADQSGPRQIARVGWMGVRGWDETPSVIQRKLVELSNAVEWREPTSEELSAALAAVTPIVREALRQLVATRWAASGDSDDSPRLLRRLRAIAREAIGRRDHQLLRQLDRAMRFAGGGHTAYEAELVARLAGVDDRALIAALTSLPEPTGAWDSVEPRLTGLALITSFPA